jgi:hypothetical protein
MKIILSRKGFDSASGGCPSPIFPDGSLLSLPIPDQSGTASLAEIRPHGVDLAHVASDLSRGRISGATRVHLDPDLEKSALARLDGWRPVFGQCEAAERHLERRGVGAGDLFVFFGWFRRVEMIKGRYRYIKGAPDLRVLFGWLKVEEVLSGEVLNAPPAWLRRHPHVDGTHRPSNTIYVAKSPGLSSANGAGAFRCFSSALQLTAQESKKRSVWRLPACFWPGDGRQPLSYHSNPARWTRESDALLLSTVGRGQEFILDSAFYPKASLWAESVIEWGTRP